MPSLLSWRVVSQGVLIVSGIREDGKREILAVDVTDVESEATYHQLFSSLKARGLKGVELITSDDHSGLRSRSRNGEETYAKHNFDVSDAVFR